MHEYFGEFNLRETHHVGHATDLSYQAVQAGASLLIAVGGDGTINEVVNGMMRGQQERDMTCTLGILNCGSGSDLARTLKLPRKLKDQLQGIMDGAVRNIDLGRVKYINPMGQWEERYFANECSLGISGAVVKNLNPQWKRFHPSLAFAIAALRQLNNYGGVEVDISTNGLAAQRKEILGIMMANGRFAGGGMKLAPRADLSDRMLDVLTVDDMGFIRRLLTFGQIYFGQHLNNSKTHYQTAQHISIQTKYHLPLELDGELVGTSPCEVQACPGVLQVKY